MKKHYIQDYLGYIVLKLFGPVIRILPLGPSFFIGRTIGRLLYYFDLRHRALVHSNIKQAMSNRLTSRQISKVTKDFYLGFGQNLVEIFLLPLVDKKYFNKYITVEGRENITEAFKEGKGVILLGIHAGGWELSNVVCANLGFPFNLLVRDQGLPRMNELLNFYRYQKGCKLIQRDNQTRGLIEALKNNEAVGMTADQGGKTGELVRFFGKEASMPTGAIKLGLRYGAVILPAYYTRVKGPYQKVIIGKAFNPDKNISVSGNLQALIPVFEQLIIKYPQEYFWSYKIWKYSKEKNILILSDGKMGHRRQSEAVASIVKRFLSEQSVKTNINLLEVEFKNNFFRHLLNIGSCFGGKYSCQGCLWCLRKTIKDTSLKPLTKLNPDIIISCGSSLAAVNFILSKENSAKSIVLMRPSVLNTGRFDLVIMPRHDHPPKKKNVLITEGALNLIDENYLKQQSDELIAHLPQAIQRSGHCLGFLVGGNNKNFHLDQETIKEVIKQIKSASSEYNADILATTSRRTSRDIENILKNELKDYPACMMLVIANEKNPAFTIGGILGTAGIIITSPESISMISEAVNSKKYVIVFNSPVLGRKHREFLDYFSRNKYIYLVEPSELNKTIGHLLKIKPPVEALKDNELIAGALKRIL